MRHRVLQLDVRADQTGLLLDVEQLPLDLGDAVGGRAHALFEMLLQLGPAQGLDAKAQVGVDQGLQRLLGDVGRVVLELDGERIGIDVLGDREPLRQAPHPVRQRIVAFVHQAQRLERHEGVLQEELHVVDLGRRRVQLGMVGEGAQHQSLGGQDLCLGGQKLAAIERGHRSLVLPFRHVGLVARDQELGR